MSTVTIPAPMEIKTLQGIEKYADETGQNFFDLLMQRFEVLCGSTATEVHAAAKRHGTSAGAILAAADAALASLD